MRVLVVDDDFMVARLHSTVVRRTPGFHVVGEAHSGRQALASARELRPDLILLDIYLPDIGGLDVLRELRGGDSPAAEADVLVITAAQEMDTIRAALRGGSVHYIIKPFDVALLEQRLRDYARHHRVLATTRAPGQEEVDRLFGAAAGARLPKGLSDETAGLVRDVLAVDAREPDGLSASECASRAGLSRVTARRYLEHFATTGEVTVSLRYGVAGRPERRFHWVGRA
ncbi:response regulator [Streptomyces radicis]|uniref:Transcriptional regulatory protein n=1 Tax=Streptomyces radicis TaxID=1750517 RepID=A0A3A9W9T4_9ACTN|nr:response regulator [Streptomyces radicis]RKN22896.1 response regulator [Streptomyces radicis]